MCYAKWKCWRILSNEKEHVSYWSIRDNRCHIGANESKVLDIVIYEKGLDEVYITMRNDNIVLIGMPGAGKSTVGVVLAKKLGYAFVDSDLIIQSREGKLLHEIITERGNEGFWFAEEMANLSIDSVRTVIATGGSAVYGSRAMEHFKKNGTVIYLKLSYDEIADRLGDLDERGVTLRDGQGLAELYTERSPLYEKYADISIDCENLSIREIVEQIVRMIPVSNQTSGR